MLGDILEGHDSLLYIPPNELDQLGSKEFVQKYGIQKIVPLDLIDQNARLQYLMAAIPNGMGGIQITCACTRAPVPVTPPGTMIYMEVGDPDNYALLLISEKGMSFVGSASKGTIERLLMDAQGHPVSGDVARA